MGRLPVVGQEIRSNGGFLIPRPAVVDPQETVSTQPGNDRCPAVADVVSQASDA